MPRIQPIVKPSPDAQAALEKTLWRDGRPYNIFTTLAHHPQLLRRINALGGLYLRHGLLSDILREAVILRVAVRSDCRYEYAQHVPIAIGTGLTDTDIEHVRRGTFRSPANIALALLITDEMIDTGTVSPDTWARVAHTWGEAEVLELITLVGYYRMVALMLNTTEVDVEPGAAVQDFPHID